MSTDAAGVRWRITTIGWSATGPKGFTMTGVCTDSQALSSLEVGLQLARRIELAPSRVSISRSTWLPCPRVYVSVDMDLSGLRADVDADRREALRQVASMAQRLAKLGEVTKESGDYTYTLETRFSTEVLSVNHAPLQIDVVFTAAANVEMVCEIVPVVDDDGEPVLEPHEKQVATYTTVTDLRPKTNKVCPPSLLEALR